MQRALFLLLTLGTALSCCGESAVSIRPDDDRYFPGQARITYSGYGHPSIKAALTELAKTPHLLQLRDISLQTFSSDLEFQKEVFASLEKLAPKELQEAKRSAGNSANPKMRQLLKPLEKALLATPTVKTFNEELKEHGLQITGVGMEEITLDQRFKEMKTLSGPISLVVSPLANSPAKK